MTTSQNPRDLLTPAVLHILLALSAGELHGSGIKRDIESRTGGAIKLGPGTLYEAIHRLEADDWISEVPDTPGRRRNYRITDAGRRALQDELMRLDEIVSFARASDLIPDRDG